MIGLWLALLLVSFPSAGLTAAMNDYCQIPPFIGTGGEPNALLVNDASGSMGWLAYSYGGIAYDANKGYEGYFDPTKDYALEGGIWREANGTACTVTCSSSKCVSSKSRCANAGLYGSGSGAFGCSGSKPYGCCTAGSSTGDCGTQHGNYLNYYYMHRIDLLRWAMTGGRPATCNASYQPDECDPELWNETGNTATGKIGTVCNDNLDVNGDGIPDGGCILETDSGEQVRVRWNRVYAGLAYQFMTLPVKPKLGVMNFDASSGNYIRADKVFLGDFLASNNNSVSFPYKNLITNINSTDPGGSTPTGPAMWDALNYFAQNPSEFGGFTPQSGSGDRWRNPLYTCDGGGGNNCVLNSCARNFVILISDGEWNAPSSSIGSSPSCSGRSADPAVPAYCMHKGFTNQMGTASSTDDITTKINNVYTVGLFMNSNGLNAMKNIAMYGGFENSALTWPSGRTGFPTSPGSLSSPIPVVPPAHTDWDRDQDGVPDTFFSSDDALGIRQSIMDVVQDILARTTSGTAASVLASGEGSGANLVQATYYPKRRFFNASAEWIGGLQNLWYYIDPRLNNNSIREDTDDDKVLDLRIDRMASMYFNSSAQKALVDLLADTNGDGIVDGGLVSTVEIEELKNLWEAGILLWNRDSDDRTIFTPLNPGLALTNNANKFSAAAPANNIAALRPFLNTDDAAASSSENDQLAANVINYVRGKDITNYTYAAGTRTEIYRPRALQIDLNGNNNVSDTSVSVSGVSMDETVAKVWKLGDIIDSTPKISSWIGLNDYNTRYNDKTYGLFIKSSDYLNHGMVFVGSNDGMLHAFNLGTLELSWTGQNKKFEKARLTGSNLGKEMWAFIPKNVLPYLKYLKETDYCHITYVDLSPFLFDASIDKPAGCSETNYWNCTRKAESWRTIIIGGMRLGGACRDATATCTDCVKTPVSGDGYSSYFALDVTDQANPKFLWEFSHSELGFSTSGPAIVKISARTAGPGASSVNQEKNGRWFAVFGSGPTGPIDPMSQKFLGRSDQNLKIFVLDLVTGALARPPIDTGIANAFAGSMISSPLDIDYDYQDDIVYIPYVMKSGSTWNEGGVLRLITNEDANGNDVSVSGDTALNPATWRISRLMDNTGPVTSAISKAYSITKDEVRVYFGAGRYFYKRAADTDDQDGQRRLYGILDPCWRNSTVGWEPGCLVRTISELSPINLASTSGTNNSKGWYIDLEPSGPYDHDGVLKQYFAERVLTDPTITDQGYLFFTTYKPYCEECSIGGKSFLWAFFGETGAAPGDALQGSVLLQVSTGSVEQIKLSTAFVDKGKRRTAALEGVPPLGQGMALLSAPNPQRRIIHIQER